MLLLGVLTVDALQSVDSPPAATVHVAILRNIREGCEAQFESQVAAFFKEAANQPGVCGAYMIRPVEGSGRRQYGVLRTFRSEADMHRFYASDLYAHWQQAVQPLVHGEAQIRRLHGLEAFFRDAGPPPPRWKMALLTWLGVNVAVYFFSMFVPIVFGELSLVIGLLLVNALVVASLTWILMPLLLRLANRWLNPYPAVVPRSTAGSDREGKGGGVHHE